jgi:hypothetical protein
MRVTAIYAPWSPNNFLLDDLLSPSAAPSIPLAGLLFLCFDSGQQGIDIDLMGIFAVAVILGISDKAGHVSAYLRQMLDKKRAAV